MRKANPRSWRNFVGRQGGFDLSKIRMSRVLRAYLSVLERHPWKTQAATAGECRVAASRLNKELTYAGSPIIAHSLWRH